MADNQSQQNPGEVSNSFNKGMTKDYNDSFVGEGLYTHARNTVNNSHTGQVGVIGNEPSNIKCAKLPYALIGCIHMSDDQWAVFTTDDFDSEIGIFDESACTYTKIVNSKCLNFKTTHLITGAYRKRYDCEHLVYWDDGLNPTRMVDMSADKIPFITKKKIVNDCVVETKTNVVDCEALRIAALIKYPCISLSKSRGSGTLPNGSYQVCIAYTINEVRITDYIGLTEVQSLWSHENTSRALDVEITEIDKSFTEFELVVLANINQQTIAKRLGFYSTNISHISIDKIDNEAITVNISDIVLRTEPVEKSDAMYPVGNYLLRVGVYSKFRFNYQIQANSIQTNWVAVQYPPSYYHDGGHHAGYMRDEQYAFFIRWIYNTGDRSDSYHIPGRKASSSELQSYNSQDAYETQEGLDVKKWQVQNTGKLLNVQPYDLPDGGRVVNTGQMAYWESTERYPDNKPEIWGQLCGKAIRHHKFPDETVDDSLSNYSFADDKITLLGVQFLNITHPLDQNGNPIESIVGYEILRSSRQGNKSIIAKGIINNMREYDIPENPSVKGLYQNYPYNDLRADDYLTSSPQLGDNAGKTIPKLKTYKKDIFSFHGPDVTFSNPYLISSEIKLYQEVYGKSYGYFTTPYRHPRFKIPSEKVKDVSLIIAAVADITKIIGTAVGADTTFALQGTSEIPLTTDLLGKHKDESLTGSFGTVSGQTNTVLPGWINTSGIPYSTGSASLRTAANIAISVFNISILAATSALRISAQQQQIYNIIIGFLPKRQYSAQYNSYGFYNQSVGVIEGNRRRKLLTSKYIGPNIHGFDAEYQINNLYRSNVVVLKTGTIYDNPQNPDNSRFTMSKTGYSLNTPVISDISAYYGALKIAIPSQYGQLETVKQIPISTCVQATKPIAKMKFTSPVFFGGDVYINRFTEKNSMFFFNDWLLEQVDQYEYDYTIGNNVPYPRYWLNTTKGHSDFIASFDKYKSLDGEEVDGYFISRGYFYLFNSGVRDFFVESEVNVAYRDYEDDPAKRHYDFYSYKDLNMMFRSDIIKSGNYYKYDYSLSVTKLFNSQITWGSVLPRDYDPVVAATCYSYRPNRIIYSLPQQDQSKKDNWRAFLALNYKDFMAPVTSIKTINKTGALFMMKRQSPLQFMGVEELKLDSTGVKITIGDGALFSGASQLQSLVNSDESYEYGSCQSKYASIGTKYGIYWVSQDQGKVFNYAGSLLEISDNGMKWWFAKYLPSAILKQFPEYPLGDNPVVGIGVQMIYDNTNEIIYITKRDYKPIIDLKYDSGGLYSDVSGVKVYYPLGDPNAFENASWTISYDPKSKAWISFHDWIPSFLIPGKTHFMSVNFDTIWKHNVVCDSYCNFYGKDYPWEVEFVSSTGQQVTTTRSIEYLLEAYRFYNDCKDKFHILDENFDEAMIYNSEQISGKLVLHLKPKNNPVALLDYPSVTPNWIDILYAKEENKYRFNQFWDITADRHEFTTNTTPLPMFTTSANGYTFDINHLYVNYDKSPLQRKKFRHVVNRVFLRKKVSNEVKFLFKISNQKIQQSFR